MIDYIEVFDGGCKFDIVSSLIYRDGKLYIKLLYSEAEKCLFSKDEEENVAIKIGNEYSLISISTIIYQVDYGITIKEKMQKVFLSCKDYYFV